MPFAIVTIGIILLITGFNGNEAKLFARVKGDLTGQKSFIWWFLAIAVIGGIGYVPTLKPVSTAMLALIIIVLFVSNNGVFQQFNTALKNATATPNAAPGSSTPNLAPLQPLSPLPTLNESPDESGFDMLGTVPMGGL